MGLKPSKILTRKETLQYIPTLEPDNLRGGILYYDGQFDDARLAITLAQTINYLNGCLLNYATVTSLIKKSEIITGVIAKDSINKKKYEIHARGIINATGVFINKVQKMDNIDTLDIITPSQGVHIVLDKFFLSGNTAVLVPHTYDGRIIFAVPWHNHSDYRNNGNQNRTFRNRTQTL